MSWAVELQVNPGNTDQRIIVWSNGWLQPVGGATPPAQAEFEFGSPLPDPAAPTFYHGGGQPVTAAKVLSWGANPTGYTMDIYGSVYAWGGAAAPSDGGPPNVFQFLPVYGYYADFVMNPAGNGQGYALNYDGDVLAFGTGTPAIPHSAFLTGSGYMALRLYMDWTSKRYWVLDNGGRWFGFNGGNNLAVDGLPPLGTFIGPGNGIVFAGDLYDKSAAAKGWHMRQDGLVDPLGSAPEAPGDPAPRGQYIYEDLRIISSSNPIKLALLNTFGGIYEYVASTAPVVTVAAPADPQTTNTRPFVGWNVADAEGDAVATWDLAVFTAAQYGIGGFDPATSPATYRITGQTTSATRGWQIPQDLANATYRAYVRVVDTSGLASAWAFKQWVQNITRPATPTVTPTVLGALTGISVAIHTGTLITNGRFGLQYHDADWDGATWEFVQNGWDVVPNGSGDATVVDYGAGYGVQRTYRAIHYVYDTSTGAWNGSDWSGTGAATITDKSKWTLATADTNDAITVKVNTDINFSATIKAGTFWPSGRPDPIVIRDGAPKYPAIDFSLWVLDGTTRVNVERMLQNNVLLLRDPFGNRYYVVPVDTIDQEMLHAAPLPTETTPIRDANMYKIKVQRVARPKTGPAVGPLAV